MPINKLLPDHDLPSKIHYGEPSKSEIIPALSSIDVKLIQHTCRKSVLDTVPTWSGATWEDVPGRVYTEDEKKEYLKKMFKMESLPSAMETVQFVFQVSNIDLIDVTHLLRHRLFSFSAHCTADRDLRFDQYTVKPSIQHSEFYEEYNHLISECASLYARMLDSDDIPLLDARTILPRSGVNHYYVRADLRSIIPYIKQRLDRQIQPESDNVIALSMLLEISKIFPEIKYAIDLEAVDRVYIMSAKSGHGTNSYPPENKNDIFEWKPQWFIYKRLRKEFPGGHVFVNLYDKIVDTYKRLTK